MSLMASENQEVSLVRLAEEARAFIGQAKAPATLRAYRSDWRHFDAWCQVRSLTALPAAPETVALYLADLARTLKPATLQRRLTSISQAHQAAGLETPTSRLPVRETWKGIRRALGVAQHGKAPLLTANVRLMVEQLSPALIGARDQALLVIGFAGALRRSELVALDVGDVTEREDGLVVAIRRSKTNQDGAGEVLGLPWGSNPSTCPVRSLRRWLDASGIASGPIFRPVDRHGRIAEQRLSDRAVALVVKRSAEAVGLDPRLYAGHSLRAGLITSAAEAGVPERVIMAHSRHRSIPVMRRYIRGATLFQENAAASVGL
jgi:site-specific recombinase XerD